LDSLANGSLISLFSLSSLVVVAAICFWWMHRHTTRAPSPFLTGLVFAVIWTILNQFVSASDHLRTGGVYYPPGSLPATTPEPLVANGLFEFLVNVPLALLACYWSQYLLGLRIKNDELTEPASHVASRHTTPPLATPSFEIPASLRANETAPAGTGPSFRKRLARFFAVLAFMFWGAAVFMALDMFCAITEPTFEKSIAVIIVGPICLVLGGVSLAACFLARG
jgi:hypothetical protein